MLYDEIDKEVEKEAAKSHDPIAALLLNKIMSDISREHFSAGWLTNLEYSLWNFVENWNPNEPPFYGQCKIHQRDIDYLRYLSEKCQGWWYINQDGDETFISLDNWKYRFSRELN